MRYMFIVSGPESFAESGPPPAELHEAVGTLIEEAMRQGKLVSFGGLKPTSAGARVRIANGKLVTMDGPFTESKEVVGGFSIYNFASKQEALDEVQRFMALHHELWPKWQGQVELREMYEQEDDVREMQIEGSRALEQSSP
jgi:hypothetical protein